MVMDMPMYTGARFARTAGAPCFTGSVLPMRGCFSMSAMFAASFPSEAERAPVLGVTPLSAVAVMVATSSNYQQKAVLWGSQACYPPGPCVFNLTGSPIAATQLRLGRIWMQRQSGLCNSFGPWFGDSRLTRNHRGVACMQIAALALNCCQLN